MTTWATTHARTSDPRTSHEAAEQSEPLAAQHHLIILSALKGAVVGMTVEDIASRTGLEKHAVFRRMAELQKAKKATPLGLKLMATGRKGRLWFAA